MRVLSGCASAKSAFSPSLLIWLTVCIICPYIDHLALTPRISGQRGFGSVIPPNSALVFDVELVGLTSKPAHEEL
jgi:hypothetical protein